MDVPSYYYTPDGARGTGEEAPGVWIWREPPTPQDPLRMTECMTFWFHTGPGTHTTPLSGAECAVDA